MTPGDLCIVTLGGTRLAGRYLALTGTGDRVGVEVVEPGGTKVARITVPTECVRVLTADDMGGRA